MWDGLFWCFWTFDLVICFWRSLLISWNWLDFFTSFYRPIDWQSELQKQLSVTQKNHKEFSFCIELTALIIKIRPFSKYSIPGLFQSRIHAFLSARNNPANWRLSKILLKMTWMVVLILQWKLINKTKSQSLIKCALG